MYDHRIKLSDRLLSQKEPAQQLDQQKQGTQGKHQSFLPSAFPSAGNENTEKQTVNQHKYIIQDPQSHQQTHTGSPSF